MTIKVFSPKWFFQDQLSIEDQETTKELFSDFLNNDDNIYTHFNTCNIYIIFIGLSVSS